MQRHPGRIMLPPGNFLTGKRPLTPVFRHDPPSRPEMRGRQIMFPSPETAPLLKQLFGCGCGRSMTLIGIPETPCAENSAFSGCAARGLATNAVLPLDRSPGSPEE